MGLFPPSAWLSKPVQRTLRIIRSNIARRGRRAETRWTVGPTSFRARHVTPSHYESSQSTHYIGHRTPRVNTTYVVGMPRIFVPLTKVTDLPQVGQFRRPASPWSWVTFYCKSGAAMSLQLRSVPGLLTDSQTGYSLASLKSRFSLAKMMWSSAILHAILVRLIVYQLTSWVD